MLNPFNTGLLKICWKRSPAIPTATAGALKHLPTDDYTHDHQAKPKIWRGIGHAALAQSRPLAELDIYKSEPIGLIACKR